MGSVGGKEEEGSTQQFKVNGAKNKSELLAFFFVGRTWKLDGVLSFRFWGADWVGFKCG